MFHSHARRALAALKAEERGTFDALATAAGLDPRRDFRGRDLRELDFKAARLDGYDFSGSDCRGTRLRLAASLDSATRFEGAILDPKDKVWLRNRRKRLGVVRLVVREIVPGDRRKFTATSNDVDTGGGARDLRFRPEEKFRPVFARMFPGTKAVMSRRGGAAARFEVNVGEIHWRDASDPGRPPVERSGQAEIWPPTDARPGEMRLVKVHEYGFTPLLPPARGEGKTVMMLIEEAQGFVRVRFTTEGAIREGNWHRLVKPFLLRWLGSNSRSGFLDLESGEEFPQ